MVTRGTLALHEQRPLTSSRLSLSLSVFPNVLFLCLLLYSPSSSVSSFSSSFLCDSPGVSHPVSLALFLLYRDATPCESTRTHTEIQHRSRSLRRLVLYVCSSVLSTPPVSGLPADGTVLSLPFTSPPTRRCSVLRPAFIPQQNLRDYSGRRR